MAVELISKIKPKNGASFSMVDAADVSIDENDNRLDERLAEIPHMVFVNDLPDNPDPNTLYFIMEEGSE